MFRISLRISWLLMIVLTPATARSQTRVHRAVGVVQTGPNNRCGEPVWVLNGIPVGSESSGAFLGRYDSSSGATEALPIVPSDCDPLYGLPSALLATTYDDAFGALRGWTVPNVELENRHLRGLTVPAGNGLNAPIPLPGTVPPNPLPPTITQPADPITLGVWLEAAGDLEITCRPDGTASIAAGMSHLIPHGVYTLWSQWTDPNDELVATPLGGLPNTLVADAQGDAEFCREIAFCPLDLAPDSSEVQFVSVMYMGNGATYGAVPYEAFATEAFIGVSSLPFLSSFPGGILSFDHIGFRVNATGGPDPGPTSPLMCAGPAMAAAALPPWGLASVFALILLVTWALLRRTAPSGPSPY